MARFGRKFSAAAALSACSGCYMPGLSSVVRVVVAEPAEVDAVGGGRRAVACVTQHRRGATQADHDRHVQAQDDDERRDRVRRQLDVLERAVHEALGDGARPTRRRPDHRAVLVSLCSANSAAAASSSSNFASQGRI